MGSATSGSAGGQAPRVMAAAGYKPCRHAVAAEDPGAPVLGQAQPRAWVFPSERRNGASGRWDACLLLRSARQHTAGLWEGKRVHETKPDGS